MSGLVDKNIHPYMGVEFDAVVEKNGRRFRIITYQAYNALGLIGSECNGVAIMIEDGPERGVLCDEIEKQETGWFGASPYQLRTAGRLVAMDWEEFRKFINEHPRSRYHFQ